MGKALARRRAQAVEPTPIKTARVIRDVSQQNEAKGVQVLLRVNPAMTGYSDETPHEYVVSSTVVAMFSGLETLFFPADEAGNVVSYGEVAGMRGGSMEDVLDQEGYILVRDEVTV